MNYIRTVGEFHQKFSIAEKEAKTPQFLDFDLAGFRINFMLEELREYAEATGYVYDNVEKKFVLNEYAKLDLEKAFDGLLDLQYVLSGTVRLHGFHTPPAGQVGNENRFDEGFFRVHWANMEKVRAKRDGSDSKRGSAFDIVKPEGWMPAILEDLLE